MRTIAFLILSLVITINVCGQEEQKRFDLSLGYIVGNELMLRLDYFGTKMTKLNPYFIVGTGRNAEYSYETDSLGRPQWHLRSLVKKHRYATITAGTTICFAEDRYDINTAFFNVGIKHKINGYGSMPRTSALLGVFSRYFMTDSIYGSLGVDFLFGYSDEIYSFDLDLNIRFGYIF